MKKKVYLLVSIVILLISLLIFGFNKSTDNITIDNAYTKKVDRKQFAIFTKEDGEYEPYISEDSLFPDGYVLDKDASKCYDDKNIEVKPLTDILIQNENSVTVKSNQTLYCTLYFYVEKKPTVKDVIEENSKGQIQESPVEGDTLRRFQGTNEEVQNNYICFGTADKDTCTTNQDKYMYRIMGIDVNTNELKVIKKEALEYADQWNYVTHETWNDSDAFIYLNSSDFLKKETYIPNEIILNTGTKWIDTIVEFKQYYGDLKINSNDDAMQVLATEKSTWSNGENHGTVDGKIGLMYVSDYYLAVSNTAKCDFYSDSYSECKASWIHITNNDDNPPCSNVCSNTEWTMVRSRFDWAWAISQTGQIWNDFNMTYNMAMRPVFYLSSKIALEGTGEITDPYRIVSAPSKIEKVEVTSDTQDKFTIEVTASESATKYCYKLDNENQYKCTSSNTKEFTNIDVNKNYLISIYAEDIYGVKSEVYKTRRKTPKKIIETFANNQIQKEPVEGDTLKRFQGSADNVKNNYICFGTNDKEECTSTEGQSKYMYRILGVDVNTNELKVIKKEALESKYAWYNDSTQQSWQSWISSKLYEQLNGIGIGSSSYPTDIFLTNTTYVPKTNIPDTQIPWENIIEIHRWKYGDFSTGYGGTTDAFIATNLYKAEMSAIECGEDCRKTNAKIGLMYISDYPLAVSDIANCNNNYNECKASWILLQNNDSTPPCPNEWTMSRYNMYNVHHITSAGQIEVNNGSLSNQFSIRPVFYLTHTVELEGTGSIDDPYRIIGA